MYVKGLSLICLIFCCMLMSQVASAVTPHYKSSRVPLQQMRYHCQVKPIYHKVRVYHHRPRPHKIHHPYHHHKPQTYHHTTTSTHYDYAIPPARYPCPKKVNIFGNIGDPEFEPLCCRKIANTSCMGSSYK